MELDKARKKWFRHGTVGTLLLGTGISVLFDASYQRLSESVQEIWIAEGTAGFILFMSGMAFYGSAIRYMIHMDRIVEYSEKRARKRHRRNRPEQHEALVQVGPRLAGKRNVMAEAEVM